MNMHHQEQITEITINDSTVRKILVCQLRQIGDVVLATPAIELLARRFPYAEIHVLTEKHCAAMLENNPFVTTVWSIDKKELPDLIREIAFYRKVAAEKFDIVVAFQQLPRCRWVLAFSRAPVRLSYPPAWHSRWLFTHWHPLEPGYSARTKANVLKPLGIAWQGEKPRIYLTDEEMDNAAHLLEQAGVAPRHQLITLDPTHRRATRRYPARHYGRVVADLYRRNPDIRFLLLFGPGEEQEAMEVVRQAGCNGAFIIPQHILTLRQMAACMAHARMHLGNCSAPRHIAVAVDTPSMTVLGSTTSSWTFPSPEHDHIILGLDCQHCNQDTCRRNDMACLEQLAPQVVTQRVLDHLEKTGGHPAALRHRQKTAAV
jgi:heptosyltransferase-2/heptosyltransferase-3